MKVKTMQWLKAMVAAIVTGLANSFLSAVGVAGAQMVGVQVDNLSPKQLIVTTLMGGLIGMFAYLKQSPVPPDSTGNTEIFINPESKTNETKT